MASVQKRNHRGKVQYRALWRESGLGGKPRLRSKTFATAREAKACAAKMESELERRGVGDPQRHTTAQYLKRWLATLKDRGELSPATLEHYAHCIARALPWIGEIPLSKLSPQDLDSAYARLLKRGLAASTVLNVHRCLHNALEQARKWKLVSENPARDARAPTPRRSRARPFTAAEVERLFDVAKADPTLYAMVATLLTCSLRRSELIGLAFDAIDFEKGQLRVRRAGVEVAHRTVIRERAKSESSARVLAIPPELIALLRAQLLRVQEQMLKWGREYQRDPLFVFPGLAGAPLEPWELTRRMRRLLRRAGIKGAQPCHGWRHTAATALLDAGQNVKTVQTRLGHSTPAITLALYVHPVEERDAEAAEHLGKLFDR